jgi:hypothetical protein
MVETSTGPEVKLKCEFYRCCKLVSGCSLVDWIVLDKLPETVESVRDGYQQTFESAAVVVRTNGSQYPMSDSVYIIVLIRLVWFTRWSRRSTL